MAVLSVGSVSGCSTCEERQQEWEVDVGSPFYETVLGFVSDAIADGYRCPQESIRNDAGQVVAYRWLCTRCD